MIINNRQDYDSLSPTDQAAFKARLGGGIYGWRWQDGEWVQTMHTGTIERFGFGIEDFPDAPIPPMPTYNPDEKAVEDARANARMSRAKFKLALLQAGLLDSVEAEYSTWPREVQIMWDDSLEFERTHPTLLAFGEQMGFTSDQMDAIFGIGGATIT